MSAKSRGKPEFYKDECTGCGACVKVCPASAIEITDDLKTRTRRLTLRLDACLFCSSCEENCITQKGIKLGNQYDMATRNRAQAVVSVEKELLVCEACECVVGAKDHIRFLAKRLGALAYGNPAFILANQEELKLGERSLGDAQTARPAAARAAMFRVLCPRCRYTMMLDEI